MFNYIKSALFSVWSNKTRSVLTVLGVVIGVSSVAILISLGQGLKNDVSSLIQGLGTNIVVIIGGKFDTANTSNFSQTNPAQLIAGDIITTQDVDSIKAMPEVEQVTPMTLVSGNMKYEDKLTSPMIIGVQPNFLEITNMLKLEKGKMFDNRPDNYAVLLGQNMKENLFDDEDPYLKKVTIGPDEFLVLGIFEKSSSASIFSSDFDSLAVIPFDTATKLNNDQVKIFRVITKVKDDQDVRFAKDKIKEVILKNHNNEENFSVLTQDDVLDVFDQFVNLITLMISAIAAISLIVGGIGIMNIMLVTVTERTKEIGLRKALGATRWAILVQFLTEAIVITLLGSAIGLGLTLAVDLIIRLKTALRPEINLTIVIFALGVAILIGVIFGLWPALRAAKKDPIEALRYE